MCWKCSKIKTICQCLNNSKIIYIEHLKIVRGRATAAHITYVSDLSTSTLKGNTLEKLENYDTLSCYNSGIAIRKKCIIWKNKRITWYDVGIKMCYIIYRK